MGGLAVLLLLALAAIAAVPVWFMWWILADLLSAGRASARFRQEPRGTTTRRRSRMDRKTVPPQGGGRLQDPMLLLRAMGQSPWCDQLSREMLTSGRLARLVREQGIGGL